MSSGVANASVMGGGNAIGTLMCVYYSHFGNAAPTGRYLAEGGARREGARADGVLGEGVWLRQGVGGDGG